MGNRQRILDAAIELMNEKGSAVGTTLLAEHLSISPGNLYYHFRNREEILAEILGQLEADLETILVFDLGEEATPKRIATCFIGGAYVLWRYRFFFSSSIEIVINNDELSGRYRDLYQWGMGQIAGILRLLSRQNPGGLPLKGQEVDRLAKNIWVVWTGWPKFTEVLQGRQPPQQEILSCHEQLTFLWKPYIDDDFYKSTTRWARRLIKQPEMIPGYRSEGA